MTLNQNDDDFNITLYKRSFENDLVIEFPTLELKKQFEALFTDKLDRSRFYGFGDTTKQLYTGEWKKDETGNSVFELEKGFKTKLMGYLRLSESHFNDMGSGKMVNIKIVDTELNSNQVKSQEQQQPPKVESNTVPQQQYAKLAGELKLYTKDFENKYQNKKATGNWAKKWLKSHTEQRTARKNQLLVLETNLKIFVNHPTDKTLKRLNDTLRDIQGEIGNEKVHLAGKSGLASIISEIQTKIREVTPLSPEIKTSKKGGKKT